MKLVYSTQTGRFDLVTAEIATGMILLGNEMGFDRVADVPGGATATMEKVGRMTRLTVIAPNGQKLVRESGRVDTKRVAKLLSCPVINVKKSGRKVTC